MQKSRRRRADCLAATSLMAVNFWMMSNPISTLPYSTLLSPHGPLSLSKLRRSIRTAFSRRPQRECLFLTFGRISMPTPCSLRECRNVTNTWRTRCPMLTRLPRLRRNWATALGSSHANASAPELTAQISPRMTLALELTITVHPQRARKCNVHAHIPSIHLSMTSLIQRYWTRTRSSPQRLRVTMRLQLTLRLHRTPSMQLKAQCRLVQRR